MPGSHTIPRILSLYEERSGSVHSLGRVLDLGLGSKGRYYIIRGSLETLCCVLEQDTYISSLLSAGSTQ